MINHPPINPAIAINGKCWPLYGLQMHIQGNTLTTKCGDQTTTTTPTPQELIAILGHVRTVSGAYTERLS